MADFDALFIGAGHNALVCAGYLAKAGYKVGMLERRPVAGGAVVTEEIIPGYKFDLGGSAHILINHTPIVRDLELEQYGLDYIDLDPLFFAPFPDGRSITMWRDVAQTCESIATVSPEDADRYERFVREWTPAATHMMESFLHAPTPWNLGKYMGWPMLRDSPSKLEALRSAMQGYGPLLRSKFKSPELTAMIAWMAAQSGPPPGEAMSGPFALWHPMYHVSGMRRPRGGSGVLTQALARMVEAHGGSILTGAPVARILMEGGRAVGAETAAGERYTGRVVVSGAHLHTTLKMLDAEVVPARLRRKIERARTGNGFGMVVRYAMNELPEYTAAPTGNPAVGGAHHNALQLICPSLDYLDAAYAGYQAGMPSRDPALVAMTFSKADPSLAPEGKHTLFLWGQYYPYELATKESWDDIGELMAERMLDKLAEYAPNVKGAVAGKLIETPLYLERELGLIRGNVMHLEMSVNQMFFLRPTLGMSNYRGPVKGLYLTGASTHPGGGIMGAAGRNAAAVLLHDLSR